MATTISLNSDDSVYVTIFYGGKDNGRYYQVTSVLNGVKVCHMFTESQLFDMLVRQEDSILGVDDGVRPSMDMNFAKDMVITPEGHTDKITVTPFEEGPSDDPHYMFELEETDGANYHATFAHQAMRDMIVGRHSARENFLARESTDRLLGNDIDRISNEERMTEAERFDA